MDKNYKKIGNWTIDSTCVRWQDIPIEICEFGPVCDFETIPLNEYETTIEVDWNDDNILQYEHGKCTKLGTISTGVGPAFVMARHYNETQCILWAVNSKYKTLGILGFEKLHGKQYVMMKMIYVSPDYKNNRVASELMAFVINFMKRKPINDLVRPSNSIDLWKKLAQTFIQKIVYLPTEEMFDIDEVGHTLTKDQRTVMLPEDENGLGFFYTLLSPSISPLYLNEHREPMRWGYDRSRHKSLLMVMGHFPKYAV